MSLYLLDLIESCRERLDDKGGDTGTVPAGYYAYWQYTDTGCLWKNKEIVRYLKRALRDLAVRAPIQEEGITADILNEQCRLSVVANNPEVEIPGSIQTIEQVRLVSSGQLLPRTTSARLDAEFGSYDWASETGTPDRYLEPRAGYLRLYPIPTTADEIRLIVRRGFFTDFEWSHVSSGTTLYRYELSDIPDDWEESIVCAVCRYAYLKRDADTFNLQLSQEYERQLSQLIGPPVSQRQKEARRANANLAISIRGHRYNQPASAVNEDEDWP